MDKNVLEVKITDGSESVIIELDRNDLYREYHRVFEKRDRMIDIECIASWIVNCETNLPIVRHPDPDPEMLEYIGAIIHFHNGVYSREVYDINENGQFVLWNSQTESSETLDKEYITMIGPLECWVGDKAIPFVKFSQRFN